MKGVESLKRSKGDGYVEPMPRKQLQKIEKAFKKRGGIIKRDDEAEAYLIKQKAEGITYSAKTILLRKRAGRASVFEELIHATQYRNGENDGSYLSRLRCEIYAQEKLLACAKAYRLTEVEIEQTRHALDAYKKALLEYVQGEVE